MRFVLFSDLHLDAAFAWAPPAAAARRRQALRDALRAVIRLADEVDADAILCGGDLYEHERFTPDTASFLRRTFAESDRRVIIAPGNHDWYGPHSLYARTSWSDNVEVFTDDALAPITLADGLTLWGAAHLGPASTQGFLDRGFHVERSGVNLALFHGSERSGIVGEGEGKQPHAPFDGAQIPGAGLDHAFLGHFHRPKAAETHTYPGNPEPLTFGEDGDRGAVVIDVADGGAVTRRWERVAVSEVHDLVLDVSGSASRQDVREELEALVAGLDGCARVTLHGELPPEVELAERDLEAVPHGLDALVTRFADIRIAYDLDLIAEENTVRGQFVRDVRSSEDLDDDARRRVILTGLRALAGRDDLEVS